MNAETKHIIEEHKLSHASVLMESGYMVIVGTMNACSIGGENSRIFLSDCGVGRNLNEAVASWTGRRHRRET